MYISHLYAELKSRVNELDLVHDLNTELIGEAQTSYDLVSVSHVLFVMRVKAESSPRAYSARNAPELLVRIMSAVTHAVEIDLKGHTVLVSRPDEPLALLTVIIKVTDKVDHIGVCYDRISPRFDRIYRVINIRLHTGAVIRLIKGAEGKVIVITLVADKMPCIDDVIYGTGTVDF